MPTASLGGYTSGMREQVLSIPEFHGIDQSRGTHSPDACSSPDAVNFIARFGELRTSSGVMPCAEPLPDTGAVASAPVHSRIYQAFLSDSDSAPYERLVAVNQRGVYALGADGAWAHIGTIEGDECDALCYRKGTDDGFEDWLLLTDGDGNLYRWNGEGELAKLTITQGVKPDGETPVELRFQQIALLYERLWGAVTKDQPDTIYWSQTFDPENWELNYEMENDGGGFVEIPTFDGSRIRAIVAAFDDILVFKDKSIHAVGGTYPGEFSLRQVYGTQGTLAPRTIVYTGTLLYFLSCDGLCRYDGMAVKTLASAGDRKLKDTWARLNHAAIDRACAVEYNNVLYVAVPLDDDERNSCVVEYHMLDGSYSLVGVAGVDDLYVHRAGQVETLMMISGGQVLRYGAGTAFFGEPIAARWTSPEIMCGTLTAKKSTGRIYMIVDAVSLDADKAPRMKITMVSGSKERAKVILLNPGTNYIRKRVKIRGRTFRFRIENMDGNPLTIKRGMEIALESDTD